MKSYKKTVFNLTRLRNLIFNDRFSSGFGALFFTFWIGQRVYFDYARLFTFTLYALTGWLITFQFCIFVISYLIRCKAREHAHGFIEVVFPFICAGMPFALVLEYPFRPVTYNIVYLRPLSTALVIGGTLVIIAGIIFLRESFSIMTEVRKLVFNGIYRITRHPMYLGAMLTALGALFQNFGLWNCFIFIIFCICQVYRATREEIKIMRIFAEYREYSSRVGWLWKIGRQRILEQK
jgi:protein-S-isoprenylcysteine O-methyltransferase Ste14